MDSTPYVVTRCGLCKARQAAFLIATYPRGLCSVCLAGEVLRLRGERGPAAIADFLMGAKAT